MKKKIILCLILCLMLCMSVSLSAFAADIDYVTDAAGILSQEERIALNEQAKTVSEFYECGVYIVLVDDYTDYVRGSIADFSEAIYNSYNLGMGEARNGIVLSMSMDERDYDLCAYGDFAHYAFTDYGKDKLAETFLDNFRNNDWYGGFNDYIGNSTRLLEMAKQGEPLDTIVYDEVPEPPGWDAFEIMIILVVPSLIALAVCGSYALAMKTAKPKTTAHDYAYSSRAHLSVRSDRFLYHNVVRTPIVRDDDDDSRPSGGRPGGTTINVGGFSHKSGKF